MKLITLALRYKWLTAIILMYISVLIFILADFKWLTAFWSLIGVYINIHKIKWCFVIWLITNATWAVIDFMHNLPAQGALFTVYFLLAIYGLWQWHKEV